MPWHESGHNKVQSDVLEIDAPMAEFAPLANAVAEGVSVSREQIIDKTGGTPKFAATVAESPPPAAGEVAMLRDLQACIKAAIQAGR